jgi:hypothetical protein
MQSTPSVAQKDESNPDTHSRNADRDRDGDRDEDHGKWGLLGLLGLVGLAGLTKKDRTVKYTTTGTGTNPGTARRTD